MKQKFFNYHIAEKLNQEDFFVSDSNQDAYNYVINKNNLTQYSIIKGPIKSGKTHLGQIWKKNNHAITYNVKNYENILQNKKNVFIDDFLETLNEEFLFHIINHCYNNNLKILLSTDKIVSKFEFKLKDLSSRIKTFHFIEINKPDDDLIINLLTKLFLDRQIIINNPEIFSYILKRIKRTYSDIYLLIEEIDKLSLEKKRELTIPLIRELL